VPHDACRAKWGGEVIARAKRQKPCDQVIFVVVPVFLTSSRVGCDRKLHVTALERLDS
jgi:hypothetical protein